MPGLTVCCTIEVSLSEPSFKEYHEPPSIDAHRFCLLTCGLLTKIWSLGSAYPFFFKVSPANYMTTTVELA